MAIKKVFQDKRYRNRELQILNELKGAQSGDVQHPNIISLISPFHTQVGEFGPVWVRCPLLGLSNTCPLHDVEDLLHKPIFTTVSSCTSSTDPACQQVVLRADHERRCIANSMYRTEGHEDGRRVNLSPKGDKPDELFLNIVMEYLPDTLYNVARELRHEYKGQIPDYFVMVFTYQLLRALCHLKAHRIMHRGRGLWSRPPRVYILSDVRGACIHHGTVFVHCFCFLLQTLTSSPRICWWTVSRIVSSLQTSSRRGGYILLSDVRGAGTSRNGLSIVPNPIEPNSIKQNGITLSSAAHVSAASYVSPMCRLF